MDEKSKIELSQAGMEKLMAQALSNFQEERDLALERYRRQDETMNGADDFIMQGKFAVEYLKTAANRSDAIFSVVKLIKEIVVKDDSKIEGGGGLTDEMRREMLRMAREE